MRVCVLDTPGGRCPGDLFTQVPRSTSTRIYEWTQPPTTPERLSWAWGKPDADSDLDLLVVKESSLRRDKRSREIRNLFASRQFPLDVLVYTPAEVEQCLGMKGSFVRKVLDRGKVLYER